MQVSIADLKGKYYGTEITVTDDNGAEYHFKLWNSAGEPSVRELAEWELTQEQWDNNELVDEGGGCMTPAQDLDIMCDNHYESKHTYAMACKIKECLEQCK